MSITCLAMALKYLESSLSVKDLSKLVSWKETPGKDDMRVVWGRDGANSSTCNDTRWLSVQ